MLQNYEECHGGHENHRKEFFFENRFKDKISIPLLQPLKQLLNQTIIARIYKQTIL